MSPKPRALYRTSGNPNPQAAAPATLPYSLSPRERAGVRASQPSKCRT